MSDQNNAFHYETNINTTLPAANSSSLILASICASISKASNNSSWGNIRTRKSEGILHISFRNIQSLPKNANNNRNEELIADINNGEFDIIGLAENVDEKDTLKERCCRGFESSHYVTS
jgi:hypothetical protein